MDKEPTVEMEVGDKVYDPHAPNDIYDVLWVGDEYALIRDSGNSTAEPWVECRNVWKVLKFEVGQRYKPKVSNRGYGAWKTFKVVAIDGEDAVVIFEVPNFSQSKNAGLVKLNAIDSYERVV